MPSRDDSKMSDALRYERWLTQVEKPTRYVGGEWNSCTKDPRDTDCSMALAFPDIYEIGMSHLGFRILYALLNRDENVIAERVFMPWVDMLENLREHSVPLLSLENRRPLSDFDLIGFSFQSELTYTNALAMLDLGGVPLLAAERAEDDPLVLAGGPVVFNPEPMADFIDLFLIGDAEEALPEMISCYRRLRREGALRKDILRAVARIEGWYAPALYDLEPEPTLGMLIPRPKPGEQVPPRVKRRVIYDLDRFPFPEDVVVPHFQVVHDRVSWEIMRGCPVGCRFCQAGYVYRPTRERRPEAVSEGVARSLASTGFDQFSLTSLNTGEYGAVEPLLSEMMDAMEPKQISVSLGSLHATTLTENFAAQVKRVRKSGFTIAPEAGSQRLRDVINKNLGEEDILEASRLAFEAQWKNIKLYFMIGLPTETDDDIGQLVDLGEKIFRQGRRIGGGRVKVTLSASTFVPKVFTPFQWFGMDDENRFRRKQDRIRETLPRGVFFKYHNHKESWLEGVLSRADRSVGRAILAAYRRGARFDGWNDQLDTARWHDAFTACGIAADEWATRPIPLEAELPWEVIDPLIRRKWLEAEYRAALQSATALPCSADSCTGCAPFAKECVKGEVATRRFDDFDSGRSRVETPLPVAAREEAAAETSASSKGGAEEETAAEARPTYAYRARFRKAGRARFLGHLDLVRALTQAFRRAGIVLVHTQGFQPRPKIALSPALSLGTVSRAEYIDFETHERMDIAALPGRINRFVLEGIVFERVVTLEVGAGSLQQVIDRAAYRAALSDSCDAVLERGVHRFLAAETVEIERIRKKRKRTLDIRPLVEQIERTAPGVVEFSLAMANGGPSARPADVLEVLVGEDCAREAVIERTGLYVVSNGRLISPLLRTSG